MTRVRKNVPSGTACLWIGARRQGKRNSVGGRQCSSLKNVGSDTRPPTIPTVPRPGGVADFFRFPTPLEVRDVRIRSGQSSVWVGVADPTLTALLLLWPRAPFGRPRRLRRESRGTPRMAAVFVPPDIYSADPRTLSVLAMDTSAKANGLPVIVDDTGRQPGTSDSRICPPRYASHNVQASTRRRARIRRLRSGQDRLRWERDKRRKSGFFPGIALLLIVKKRRISTSHPDKLTK